MNPSPSALVNNTPENVLKLAKDVAAVAHQTRILSLNATITAAKAGDH